MGAGRRGALSKYRCAAGVEGVGGLGASSAGNGSGGGVEQCTPSWHCPSPNLHPSTHCLPRSAFPHLLQRSLALSFLNEDLLVQLDDMHLEQAQGVRRPALLNIAACQLRQVGGAWRQAGHGEGAQGD